MQALIVNDVQRSQALEAIKRLRFDGNRRWFFSLRLWRKQRTVPQNKLYWMWMHSLAADTGNTAEALHSFFGGMYLRGGLVENGGAVRVGSAVMPVVRSSSTLNTKEFSEYLEKIHLFVFDFYGVDLPWPNDLGWDHLLVAYGDKV